MTTASLRNRLSHVAPRFRDDNKYKSLCFSAKSIQNEGKPAPEPEATAATAATRTPADQTDDHREGASDEHEDDGKENPAL